MLPPAAEGAGAIGCSDTVALCEYTTVLLPSSTFVDAPAASSMTAAVPTLALEHPAARFNSRKIGKRTGVERRTSLFASQPSIHKVG